MAFICDIHNHIKGKSEANLGEMKTYCITITFYSSVLFLLAEQTKGSPPILF